MNLQKPPGPSETHPKAHVTWRRARRLRSAHPNGLPTGFPAGGVGVSGVRDLGISNRATPSASTGFRARGFPRHPRHSLCIHATPGCVSRRRGFDWSAAAHALVSPAVLNPHPGEPGAMFADAPGSTAADFREARQHTASRTLLNIKRRNRNSRCSSRCDRGCTGSRSPGVV